MADTTIIIPDIGGATAVDVIEIMVKAGDSIEKDTPLITLESDKASMEIPSTAIGTVKEIKLKIGDKVSEGDIVLILETETAEQNPSESTVLAEETASSPPADNSTSTKPSTKKEPSVRSELVKIPDIGGATDVEVIEISVKKGDSVEKDQSLLTLEGDKATMDIPSPFSGVIEDVRIAIGDKVAEGSPLLTMRVESIAEESITPNKADEKDSEEPPVQEGRLASTKSIVPTAVACATDNNPAHLVAAGPAVRRIAHELGIELQKVKGSGRKNRITKDDITSYVKNKLSATNNDSGSGLKITSAPIVDFTRFGDISSVPLNKIKRLTAINVHRSWVTIPHVTQFDEADITDLELFRKSEQNRRDCEIKLTVLAFVTKAISKALMTFPQFNASLDASGENLIFKNYFNIGIAVETPNGLVVPVIKNVNTLSVLEIAAEMSRLSNTARNKGLTPAEMSGGCFTISSLGGIGGTAFTPIVNSPEVAILGLSRARMQPVYDGHAFVPRLLLPLSLSYDHRVIDGAEAARFTRYIADLIADVRRLLL